MLVCIIKNYETLPFKLLLNLVTESHNIFPIFLSVGRVGGFVCKTETWFTFCTPLCSVSAQPNKKSLFFLLDKVQKLATYWVIQTQYTATAWKFGLFKQIDFEIITFGLRNSLLQTISYVSTLPCVMNRLDEPSPVCFSCTEAAPKFTPQVFTSAPTTENLH